MIQGPHVAYTIASIEHWCVCICTWCVYICARNIAVRHGGRELSFVTQQVDMAVNALGCKPRQNGSSFSKREDYYSLFCVLFGTFSLYSYIFKILCVYNFNIWYLSCYFLFLYFV